MTKKEKNIASYGHNLTAIKNQFDEADLGQTYAEKRENAGSANFWKVQAPKMIANLYDKSEEDKQLAKIILYFMNRHCEIQ